MLNKDEIIFTVDANNKPIEPMQRQKVHAEGIWHRTTDIIVVNHKRELICHKRSMQKDTGAGLWDSAFGGHTLAGAESLDAAALELFEESGLKPKLKDLKFIGIVKYMSQSGNNKEFRYAYLYKWNGKIEDLNLEKDEIDEAKWVPLDVVKTKRDDPEWSPMPYIDILLRELS